MLLWRKERKGKDIQRYNRPIVQNANDGVDYARPLADHSPGWEDTADEVAFDHALRSLRDLDDV